MKYIIAGGTGLVGRALVEEIKDKHEVVVLSRKPGSMNSARIVVWDAANPGDWVKELDDADVLINLTGAGIFGDGALPVRWTQKRKDLIMSSRLKSIRVLSDVLRESGRELTWVQASAIGYYGNSGPALLDENGPAGSDFLADVCIRLEDEIRVDPELVRVIIPRIGVVLSSKGGAFPLLSLPYKFVGGGPMGGGRQFISWIHIDDLVKGIDYLIRNENAEGIYNFTAPNPVTNKWMNQLLGKLTRRPAFIPIPGWLMRLGIGESADTILNSQNILPKRLQESGYPFQYAELLPALKNLLGK